MPNIILTNHCNQKCSYCFAHRQMSKNSGELSSENLRSILDFFKESKEESVRLMGGEPTLHSQFEKIVDHILSQDFSLQIFTNGIFPAQTRKFFSSKKDKIKYSFNINSLEEYNKKQGDLIQGNLRELSQYKNCLVGSVIYQKDFNLDYIVNLAKEHPIKSVVLRIANPIPDFFSADDYPILAKNIIREAQKIKTGIGFGCGLPEELFNEEQKEILKEMGVDLKYGCDANSGRFDIGTDLSVFRCFPMSDWKKKNLLDFKNTKEIEKYFSELMFNSLTKKTCSKL